MFERTKQFTTTEIFMIVLGVSEILRICDVFLLTVEPAKLRALRALEYYVPHALPAHVP